MMGIRRAAMICFFALATSAVIARGEEPKFRKTTHPFKTVGELKLKADVYRHDDAAARPVVVWLHGGALILGSRTTPPKQVLDLAEEKGLVLVSLDYRLAPETQLPEIIEDLRDGLAWVQKDGPKVFQADASRIVVAGASAGGYLALMSPLVMNKPPRAVVSYWGFGDVDGDWTTKPNASYSKGGEIDRETAWSGVGKKPLVAVDRESGPGRARFFLYLKQTGKWLEAVSGLDPTRDKKQISKLCPVRNVTPKYPRTLFLHGTADKDVPVEQTLAMARELKRNGVDHEVITIEGGGHSLWGGDRKKIEQAFARSMAYIAEQLD